MSINYKQPHNKLIVILGPTASGKTNLAIKLAKIFNGEIVCADSRTIYKGMDIGTAKPQPKAGPPRAEDIKRQGPKTINGIPHYLIDIKKPNESFSVAEFKEQALIIINDIQKKKKIPFLVGGTGLYVSSIVNNLEIPIVAADYKLRKKLGQEAKKHGLEYLYKKLIKLDPESQKFIDAKNSRRIIRALEVCLKTGQPFSESRKKSNSPFRVLQIGINLPREQLYEKINHRVDQMIKDGLIPEVKKLNKKYSPSLPSMSGLGYRQITSYLKNKVTLPEAIELIKKDTRHYAKRQLTWFKRDKDIKWLDPKNIAKAQKLIKKFLKDTH